MKRFKFATIQVGSDSCHVFFSDDLAQMNISEHSHRIICENRDQALIFAAQNVLPAKGRINERVAKNRNIEFCNLKR